MPALAYLSASLAVIGCGNPNRGDDGVGPAVIARLRDTALPAHVQLYDAGTDGMAVLYRARGLSHLVVVDARAPSGSPGAVFDVPGPVLEAAPPQHFTSHDFRWDHALYAGRRLYGAAFPSCVRVFLVEAASTALGIGLSPDVARAVDEVCARIGELAKRFESGAWA